MGLGLRGEENHISGCASYVVAANLIVLPNSIEVFYWSSFLLLTLLADMSCLSQGYIASLTVKMKDGYLWVALSKAGAPIHVSSLSLRSSAGRVKVAFFWDFSRFSIQMNIFGGSRLCFPCAVILERGLP
eukprot:666807-Amphidinium_carterae.1